MSPPPPRSRPSPSPAHRDRRRRTHQRVDSYGDLPPPPRSARRHPRGERHDDDANNNDNGYHYASDRSARDGGPGSPSKARPKDRRRRAAASPSASTPRESRLAAASRSAGRASAGLSVAQLARLDRLNERLERDESDGLRPERVRPRGGERAGYETEREVERTRRRQEHRERKRRREEHESRRSENVAAIAARSEDDYWRDRRGERRTASGQALERGEEYYSEKRWLRDDGRTRAGSDVEYDAAERKRKRKKKLCIGVGVLLLLLAIIIPVAIVTSKKSTTSSSSSSGSSSPTNSNLDGISESSIPKWARGTYLDPFDWYTTLDFNVTFTDQTVGGLYVMGLNSTWDDDTQANDDVPKLNEKWEYGTMKMRGVNLGGWLSIEPFITPSLFDDFDTSEGVVDEWTLTETLGADEAKSLIEQHYATFISEQTFADIAAAGFDHVRIPYSYWAVKVYDGDPYVPMVSWRYLLRGIEWARKYGLRINLDLHGLPGSQNGMNHSGRQGIIRWLNGTDGTLNGNRSIELHDQLTQFFTQDRYQNIIALYGLANEPRMTYLDTDTVLDWSKRGIDVARANGYTGLIVVGDGFFGLEKWKGKLQDPKVVLDAHQYVIFNTGQIIYDHTEKVTYACEGWTQQAEESMDKATGFGPTIFGEWSQADTDCADYLNNVGVGSRWEGTLNYLDAPGALAIGASIDSVLTPTCPTDNDPRCDCAPTAVDPSSYSAEYKKWLLQFAEAQMYAFEYGWGWFYWTWKTETATQWSYQAALAAGFMPANARVRSWNCNDTIPSYNSSGLPESY